MANNKYVSRAFCSRGTATFVNGKQIAEVRTIRVVAAGVEVEANWIPDDEVHRDIIAAIQDEKIVTLSATFPDRGTISAKGFIEGSAWANASDVATLRFTVKNKLAYGSSDGQ